MKTTREVWGRLLAGGLASGLVWWGWIHDPMVRGADDQGDAPALGAAFSGQATGVDVTDAHRPGSNDVLIADTGPLPATGGRLAVSVGATNVQNGSLQLESADARTEGRGLQVRSGATATGLSLSFVTAAGASHTITAAVIRVEAMVRRQEEMDDQPPLGDLPGRLPASRLGRRPPWTLPPFRGGRPGFHPPGAGNPMIPGWRPGGLPLPAPGTNGVVATAWTRLEGLAIDGQPVTVTGEINQTLTNTDWHLVINEQTVNQTNNQTTIDVVGLHLVLDGGLDARLGELSAGLQLGAPAPPPPEFDSVLGAGWITNTPSSDKGTFALHAGIQQGHVWGWLDYADEHTGMAVRSTTVSAYTVSTNGTRQITFTVGSGSPTTSATVNVLDDDNSPTNSDSFAISLSSGYQAGGALGGGTIELAAPRPRSEP